MSSDGPITLFDKSLIHLISFDEAALFGRFYRANLTPLFFVETLADLKKTKGLREGQSPEDLVKVIAAKTASLTFDPSVHHNHLVLAALMGERVLMDGRPHMALGRSVRKGDQHGIIFSGSPEVEAFYRWQAGRFSDIERDMAQGWRDALQSEKIQRLPVRDMFPSGKPKTLAEVKRYADTFVRTASGPNFLTGLDILGVPSEYRGAIFQRWLAAGAPSLARFAPYAAYVASVKLFFQVAVSVDLISGERASHAADIAYLYYLPFCMVFVSNDRLHAQTVPLFLRPDQEFLTGDELKADLRRLDEYFSQLPKEVLDRGVISFDPPTDGGYLTTRLWRKFLPGWRPDARAARVARPRDPEKDAKLLAEFRAAREAPDGPPVGVDEADFVVIERFYPFTMGKYRLFPPEVEEGERARRAAARAQGAGDEPEDGIVAEADDQNEVKPQ